MLKKSASGVLVLLRGSTLRRSAADIGSTGGYFPFAKIHCMGERLHEVRVRTLLASSLTPALLDGLFEHPEPVCHRRHMEDSKDIL
jgi:hypothetical protein